MIGNENRKTGYRVSDPRMIRLRNPATGRYLHLSATTETEGTGYAWLGYRHQATTLRNRAKTRGDDWPYEVEA